MEDTEKTMYEEDEAGRKIEMLSHYVYHLYIIFWFSLRLLTCNNNTKTAMHRAPSQWWRDLFEYYFSSDDSTLSGGMKQTAPRVMITVLNNV